MKQAQLPNRILLSIIFIGCLFFSFNTVMTRGDSLWMYDSKRLFVCAIIVIFCLGLALFKEHRLQFWSTFSNVTPLCTALVMALFTFAAIANWQRVYVWSAQENYFYILGLAIVAASLVPILRHHRVLVFQYFSWISIFLFLSVASVFWFRAYMQLPESVHSILNPRFINQVQIWLLIPIFYLTIICKRKQYYYYVMQVICALNVTSILATDAQGIAAVGVFSILLWALLEANWRKEIVVLLIQSIIWGVIFHFILLSPVPEWFLNGSALTWNSIKTESSGQVVLYLEAFSQTSFWGLGGDSFLCLKENFSEPLPSPQWSSVSWGIIPLISYLLLITYGFISVSRTKNQMVRVTGLSLLIGLSYSLISGVLDSPISQLLAAFSLAMYWASIKPAPSLIRHSSYLQHVIIISVSVLCIFFVTNKVKQRVDLYPQVEQASTVKAQLWLGYECLLPEQPNK
ncbi:hypothetical protein KP803_04210 [Vibrio sp. ZSDE26]|uniref:O-antigen ligase domain-containing protein n=1 Tax=Vibrio amylolyticus TaxID=2847292 RepID=A0A9X1XGM5_9VIBR|nr:hypothetical protein [Vibrio amylolyticus]MCK6262471.1 hypothetical protein [Vibrio amylolyticus]